jgi:hypothetical protein
VKSVRFCASGVPRLALFLQKEDKIAGSRPSTTDFDQKAVFLGIFLKAESPDRGSD